jgi:hypothetical protein
MQKWMLKEILGVKKRVTDFKVDIAQLYEHRSPSYAQRPINLAIWDIFVLSLHQALYVAPMHVKLTFNTSSHTSAHSFQKFLVLLKSPNRYFLLVSMTPLHH